MAATTFKELYSGIKAEVLKTGADQVLADAANAVLAADKDNQSADMTTLGKDLAISGAVYIMDGTVLTLLSPNGDGGTLVTFPLPADTPLPGAPVPPGPTPTSIAVLPSAPAPVPVGGTQQFTSAGAYPDGTTKDLAGLTVWSSDAPPVATVDPAGGLATAVSVGSANIISTFSGVHGSAVFTVGAPAGPTVSSIAVLPSAPASIPVGGTQPFTSAGTFSDGSIQDLGGKTAWSSDNPAVATVDPASGLATAVAVGTANIISTFSGVHGQSVLTVA